MGPYCIVTHAVTWVAPINGGKEMGFHCFFLPLFEWRYGWAATYYSGFWGPLCKSPIILEVIPETRN